MFTGFAINEKCQKDWIQNIFRINVEYRRVILFSTVEIDTERQGFISHLWGSKFYQDFDKIGHKKKVYI